MLSAKSVAGFPVSLQTHSFWPWLGSKPVGEDGFYMLTVADNISRFHRIIYNYCQPTTGIQPLATFAFAGLDQLVRWTHGSSWTLIRFVLFGGCTLFLAFAWLIGHIASRVTTLPDRHLVFTIGFFLTLCDYTLFRLFTYGLETGIYLCCVGLVFWVYLRLASDRRGSWAYMTLLGLAGGVAGLARIDFGIIFLAILAWLAIRRWATLLQVLVSGTVALLVTSPWLFYVHSIVGSWLPSSGRAESQLISLSSLDRIPHMVAALGEQLMPWCYLILYRTGNTVMAIASALAIVLLARRAPLTVQLLKNGGAGYLIRITPWLVAIAALALVYMTMFWPTFFYARYTAPLFVIALPVMASILAEQGIVRMRPLVVVIPLVALFVFYDAITLHTGSVGGDQIIEAGYVEKYYPKAHVGSFQSGTIGYFNRNVENLDGKINNDALKAKLKDELPEYIDRTGIDVLVDWPGYLDSLPVDYRLREWVKCPQPMPEPEGECLIRKAIRSESAASGRGR
jgi:hypothetical protein